LFVSRVLGGHAHGDGAIAGHRLVHEPELVLYRQTMRPHHHWQVAATELVALRQE
jgi:hypothetical protein